MVLVKGDEKPVGDRLHFALKCGPDSELCRYKALCVAKGFTNCFGMGYYGTYSHTTFNHYNFNVSADSNDYQFKKLVIRAAYLSALIEEDVVINQPEGNEHLDENGTPFIN